MANQTFTDGPTLNDGVKMPWLGLGVWKTKEGEEVIQSVKSAIAAGYRSIDTAAVYGNEEGVGQAIRESGVSRDELFITTKVWNEDQGYEKTLQAFETSRKKLGLDFIDLYLVHWPGKDKYLDTWKALIHLQREGLVRSIGVSNFQIRHLQHIMEDTGVVPVVNQVELHPLLSQKELLGYARENHIVLEAWSPLMQGNLDQPVLAQIAEKYGKTTAQVILRWDIQNGIIVIPKSIKDHRIRENAGIFDFELSAADMAAIDGLNQNKRFGSNPDEFLF
ncbi:2,5-didehydrogluconate reductase [Paenibacillus vortex V453]|jgi:diketogulonate reductase-like aldo/keto reductase|uniref:2,5-didehydrogluconate reductase n=1 Tax=Paenibacillus vortex V453 TaxID=715225 RepID=A0A2R9T0S2_9BACL|nr:MULTISPECIES: aldo/keto reductase [Paenibacillus]ANA80672.1 glyoxal reductase [Paenibacillus glucanolyticus]AVV55257.1 aldo/keto reductase [Paenibacillus glucanolyticus]AWP29843.1 aldo/keto reductase [Paenibacillus sp. Cedars]EFU43120.1 2,5-didehydrogluconate reductase [Paenibacillus vortex V453]ETT30868.1 2,5-didehydrogluconate reductase [Paenibacillus sp. FSL R5-808]